MLPVCVDFIIMYTKTHFLFLFVELFCCCENSSFYFLIKCHILCLISAIDMKKSFIWIWIILNDFGLNL